jgi:hypothetical protein
MQALPIKYIHLFNNVINYLVHFSNAAVALCAATPLLLGNIDPEKSCLKLF